MNIKKVCYVMKYLPGLELRIMSLRILLILFVKLKSIALAKHTPFATALFVLAAMLFPVVAAAQEPTPADPAKRPGVVSRPAPPLEQNDSKTGNAKTGNFNTDKIKSPTLSAPTPNQNGVGSGQRQQALVPAQNQDQQSLDMLVPAPANNLPLDLVANNLPVIVSLEAHAGRPYGVGKISYRLRQGDEMIARTGATFISESENRIHFPVISYTPARKFLQSLIKGRNDQPDDLLTIWFLFNGDRPLNVRLDGSGHTDFEVPIEFTRPRRYERYVKNWWQSFNSSADAQIESGDYPPMVETYLTALIGKRLGMELPVRSQRSKDPLMRTFELLFDVESLRIDNIEQAMLLGVDSAKATMPLPAPIEWTPLVVTDLPEDVSVEALAQNVPQECFYVRFGNWDNQIWLQRLMEEYGGDLGRMISLRGFKAKIQSKFLDQLAIQSSEFDKLFGGKLIDDVGVIGMDTYFDSGSAIGVMLHAKNTKLLKNSLSGKRKAFAKKNAKIGVTIEELKFGEHSYTILKTPDNRYRSFYVVDGDNHLITTSETIARRFVEASQGIGSLADTAEFKFARYNLPIETDHTLFVYASTAFFQQLLTPEYQIELRRRNEVITNILLLEMAKLGAESEQGAGADQSVASLIEKGYLPENFGSHADESTFSVVDGEWQDSIRGQRGFFVPIPDMKISSATAAETAWFAERATFFANNIRSLDPMSVGISRFDRENDVERVVFDARVLPFGEEKYDWLFSMLGPPLKQEVLRSPDDIIRFEASLKGGKFNQDIQQHQVFAAVQDYVDPNLDLRPKSVLKLLDTVRQTPGYLGAWPNPGYTNWMPQLGGAPDSFGYTYSRLLGLWRLQWEGYSILGFDQRRLESLKDHLRIVPSERYAQVRLEIGDLASSKISAWANTINYRRSWQTSIANVRLLNMLSQQFRIEPELARATAERMLDVELVCSLGGEYELISLPSNRKLWHSTAWPSFSNPILPGEYKAPLLKWFRGLDLEVTKSETQFSVHGFLDIQRSGKASALPSFDLFKGFGNMFGGDKKKADESKK